MTPGRAARIRRATSFSVVGRSALSASTRSGPTKTRARRAPFFITRLRSSVSTLLRQPGARYLCDSRHNPWQGFRWLVTYHGHWSFIDRLLQVPTIGPSKATLRDGRVFKHFATASTYGHLPSPRESRKDYIGQIDEFAIYCPDTEGVYLIPIEDVLARTNAHLRVEPPLNGQRKRIRYAKDYEIARVNCLAAEGSRRQLAISAV